MSALAGLARDLAVLELRVRARSSRFIENSRARRSDLELCYRKSTTELGNGSLARQLMTDGCTVLFAYGCSVQFLYRACFSMLK